MISQKSFRSDSCRDLRIVDVSRVDAYMSFLGVLLLGTFSFFKGPINSSQDSRENKYSKDSSGLFPLRHPKCVVHISGALRRVVVVSCCYYILNFYDVGNINRDIK